MDTFAFQHETIQNAAQTPAARTQRERQPISEPGAASCCSGLSQSERSARRRVFCELAVGGLTFWTRRKRAATKTRQDSQTMTSACKYILKNINKKTAVQLVKVMQAVYFLFKEYSVMTYLQLL